MNQNILIIGAGAVGLVYGKHFSDAGKKVRFLVKENHLQGLKEGVLLYNLGKDAKREKPILFNNYALISNFETLSQTNWQQIYLCFSSVALHAFDFQGLKKNLQGSPTIVLLQPGITDFSIVEQHFPSSQIVQGMISLISYYTPLPAEKAVDKGIAYWLPPLVSTPFSGEKTTCKAVIQTFKKGRISANKIKDVSKHSLFPSAFLVTFLVVLEANNWNFKTLKANKNALNELCQANKEMFSALSKKYTMGVPLAFKLANRVSAIKTLLNLAPRIMPLDLEAYLKAHFTKVNEQTKMYLNDYLTLAKTTNTSYEYLEKLRELNG